MSQECTSLREVEWKRFVRAPDAQLLDELYIPALSRAVRYDRCCAYVSSHVLALAARGIALQQGWNADGLCARLMEALVNAAPPAVRFPGKGEKKTAADEFPEFRAWHTMLKPLFGIEPPEWKEPVKAQPALPGME